MMELQELKRLGLREIWAKEAGDFTPWLAENLDRLGAALGMELELSQREAPVGEFSLDLLATDLGSGQTVIIENQLTPTDHDHLGKLLTYAAGFEASIVIWVAQAVRDEHRQALEWLNRRTDLDTQFFGVVVEVLQIGESAPACDFKLVVFPNEWQKSKRRQNNSPVSSRGEAYRAWFQGLIDELREKHRFTAARIGQPQSWYSFSAGTTGFSLAAVFAGDSTARVELYIDRGDAVTNKAAFEWLHAQKDAIERELGVPLEWQRLDEKRASRVFVARDGSIDYDEEVLQDVRNWSIDHLLRFKRVFAPLVKQAPT